MTKEKYVPPCARFRIPGLRSLKVISYNILAPKYAGWNKYCPPEFLAWEYRRGLILKELDEHAADIVGLQECDMEFFNAELRSWMGQRGMQGEFLPRMVGPIPGPTEGIALLWRSADLELVAQRSLLFSEQAPQVAGLPEEVAETAPWRKLRTLGEGAVMALLRHRPTGRPVVAAVTHLFWDPAVPDVKVLQAALLCGAIAAFAGEATAAAPSGGAGVPPPPVLLFGDFNSLASKRLPDKFDPQIPPDGLVSGVYTLLSHGSLPPDHPDHPASRVWEGEAAGGAEARGQQPGTGGARFPAVPITTSGLQLASLSAQAFGREPPVTNRTATWAGCLDYIWMSRSDFTVASALSMPYDDGGAPPMGPAAAGGSGGSGSGGAGGAGDEPTWRDPLKDIDFWAIPDEFYPSDHLAVGGEVVLLGTPAE